MKIIGIDCGVSGAIAVIEESLVRIYDIPTKVEISGKNKKTGKNKHKTHYLPSDIVTILENESDWTSPDLVVIEQVSSMPRDGVVQAFSLGYGSGLIQGICHSLHFPILLVRPSIWKKSLNLNKGSTKEDSINLAKTLYPQAEDFIKLKKHDGRAEALLLAHYGVINGNK
jgi:crossover junction endodeoxyribonuclease RuvC